jgi:transposase
MVPTALFPISNLISFQALEQREDHFVLELLVESAQSICPDCGQKSHSRHSKYIRKLRDLPWAGIPVKVNLYVNKYYCKNENCSRKIFTERFGEGLKPYARRTLRLTGQLAQIGYALGGKAGSKLASFLGMPTGRSTMLRIIYNAIDDIEIVNPRVLGIDDWAFKKGNTYGTILVDLEKRQPIDLLPDREVETVRKWLEAHPSVEIITRDRASCYSQGAELGAPQAIQVADRWHLLKNLGDALKRLLDKHNQELRLAAKDIAQAERDQEQSKEYKRRQLEIAEKGETNRTPVNKEQTLSKYELNFLEVKRLKSKGHSIRSIHRQTGIHRQTIKRYLKYEQYPQKAVTGCKTSKALPFEDYLRKRWGEGETNHMQLWRELKERGFTGSSQSVYRFVCKYPKDRSAENLPPPLAVKTWPVRKVSSLMNKPFEDLDEASQNFLRAFYKRCPQANKASQLARKFKSITDKLRRKHLNRWINMALDSSIPPLKNFAKGLQQDYDAVKAAVSLKWSNGQVEGQVNRLKNIKRQMYGRASFELLRKRVLMDSG